MVQKAGHVRKWFGQLMLVHFLAFSVHFLRLYLWSAKCSKNRAIGAPAFTYTLRSRFLTWNSKTIDKTSLYFPYLCHYATFGTSYWVSVNRGGRGGRGGGGGHPTKILPLHIYLLTSYITVHKSVWVITLPIASAVNGTQGGEGLKFQVAGILGVIKMPSIF